MPGLLLVALCVSSSVYVHKYFKGRARGIQPVLVNGAAGAMWAPNGQPRGVFRFTINNGKITEIQLLADPAQLNQLDLY